MQKYIIDSKDKLQGLCEQLAQHRILAMDTEFLREKTYYAQLCLIQIASGDVIACVDPLAIDDIQPLLDLIYDPARTVIMHSARQDLELFYDLTGKLPDNLFDTQIAATLLGHGDQIGYANLVKDMLGVSLDKSQTRTDWSRRPLTNEQIDYALDDVRYLIEIADKQNAALQQKGRSQWLVSDFAALSDLKTFAAPEQTLWHRVRGSNSLRGVQLAVLQQLAIWREQVAREKNRPRRWILSDDVLLDLAKRLPATPGKVEAIRGMEAGQKRYTDAILHCIEQAKTLPQADWPLQPDFQKLSPTQEALADVLTAIVKTRALQNGISVNSLATRKELTAILSGIQESSIFTGWRYELAGKDVQDFIDGCSHVQYLNGELEIVPGEGAESAETHVAMATAGQNE